MSNNLNQYTRSYLPTSKPIMQTLEYDADGNLTNFWAAGDVNCDGGANTTDINAFVLACSDPAGYHAAYPGCKILNGDLNGDGQTTTADVTEFSALLSAGGSVGPSRVFTWDAENRLVAVGPADGTSRMTGVTTKAAYRYDYQGRRIEKRVWRWTAGTPRADSRSSRRTRERIVADGVRDGFSHQRERLGSGRAAGSRARRGCRRRRSR